ncbi:hypothetical protein [Peptoniphilus indolicus]|uniref:TNFR-Cys domain-containing protein n=2 Tax=Peptoniphilus indolicus TaxID=33030 RepID=G4D5F3_9FIRM|nr:hypothetical protein [Peptoniphilus indolicus]EGY78999.1 hypothetical protein HMPREF9129_1633 [Peptoniphilus indolicus ATCC 29427]SUB74371.1 Uncharacterised protein [Peptoniphilus indolicus]
MGCGGRNCGSAAETGIGDDCVCMSGQNCYESSGCGYCERCESCESTCENSCQTTCEKGCQSDYQKNTPPRLSGGIRVSPIPIRGGEIIQISWNNGSDSESNLSHYVVERSLNNGIYTTIESRAKNTRTSDTVPKGTVSVRYRVKAVDIYGAQSSSIYGEMLSVVNNTAPVISGSDLDLGSKQSDFTVNYMITDVDDADSVTVTIQVDDKVLQKDVPTTLGISKEIRIKINEYELGRHDIKVTAKDKEGLTTTRTFTFTKTNTAPVISGIDKNLGNKNSAFTVNYTVVDENGDKVDVIERLNGKVLRNVSNIGKDKQFITISTEQLQGLEINQTNTIEIEAKDSNNAVSYRRFIFRRSNFAPVISGSDLDLGNRDTEISYKYSITDQENDEVNVKVYLDNKLVVKEFKATNKKQYTYEVKGFEFLKIPYGKRTIKIVATDSNGLSSQRIVSFTRTAKKLVMQLKEPRITDVLAKKVLVIPGWFVAPGAISKVEVCNNAFDYSPTWEDATVVTNEGRAFNFVNKRASSSKFGVNIRLTIEKGKAVQRSYITTIGGSVE